ncbi:MAG: TFIIB-type zinc finger domain-containing protein [Dialister invisus]
MKKLICEMCGGNDLIREEGFVVCQYCGTKYTLEQADRMAAGEIVHIGGTVSIDNRERISTLLESARLSRIQEDWKATYDCYNKVLQYAPQNIEGMFYRPYAKIRESFCRLVEPNQRVQLISVLLKTFPLIERQVTADNPEFYEDYINKIGDSIEELTDCGFSYHVKKDKQTGSESNNKSMTAELIPHIFLGFAAMCENIAKGYLRYNRQVSVRIYLRALHAIHKVQQSDCISFFFDPNKDALKKEEESLLAGIKEADPTIFEKEEKTEDVNVGIMFWVGLVITILVWIFMGIGGAFYYIIFILITRGFVSVTRKFKQKIDIDLCQGEITEETEGTTEKDHSMLDDFYSAFCLLWAGIEVLWDILYKQVDPPFFAFSLILFLMANFILFIVWIYKRGHKFIKINQSRKNK